MSTSARMGLMTVTDMPGVETQLEATRAPVERDSLVMEGLV